MLMTIRNPIEWTSDQLRLVGLAAESVTRARDRAGEGRPEVRRIEIGDLRQVLRKGLDDFAAYRTDAVFLCLIYPVVGLVMARLASGYGLVPLLFPIASGFALVGPAAAVGVYEISRRHELGHAVAWRDAFGFVRSRSFGAILGLGLILVAIFLVWLGIAQVIYNLTLGPEPPASIGAFIAAVLTTSAGWAMIVVGVGVGFLFALLVLLIGVVSFPLLLDRDVGIGTAMATSARAVATNPGPMAVWGLIVAAGLALGTIPLLLGLIFVMPVLGHATWHLYRRLVPRRDTTRG
jgi:uncharacterized membrane protein